MTKLPSPTIGIPPVVGDIESALAEQIGHGLADADAAALERRRGIVETIAESGVRLDPALTPAALLVPRGSLPPRWREAADRVRVQLESQLVRPARDAYASRRGAAFMAALAAGHDGARQQIARAAGEARVLVALASLPPTVAGRVFDAVGEAAGRIGTTPSAAWYRALPALRAAALAAVRGGKLPRPESFVLSGRVLAQPAVKPAGQRPADQDRLAAVARRALVALRAHLGAGDRAEAVEQAVSLLDRAFPPTTPAGPAQPAKAAKPPQSAKSPRSAKQAG